MAGQGTKIAFGGASSGTSAMRPASFACSSMRTIAAAQPCVRACSWRSASTGSGWPRTWASWASSPGSKWRLSAPTQTMSPVTRSRASEGGASARLVTIRQQCRGIWLAAASSTVWRGDSGATRCTLSRTSATATCARAKSARKNRRAKAATSSAYWAPNAGSSRECAASSLRAAWPRKWKKVATSASSASIWYHRIL